MSSGGNKRQEPTKQVRDALIMAALASGTETQDQIARRLGFSRQHVSKIANEHRAEIEAEAAKTKEAAIVGPARARQMAADATPRAIEVLVELMDGDSSGDEKGNGKDGPTRIAAAKTILDRGGVPARTDVDIAGSVSIADLIAAKVKGG